MFQTAYKPILTLGKTAGGFVGGFCRWWYTPIQNITNFPAVNPLTQMLATEPVLATGKSWYGPVDVPDNQLGWQEDSQIGKPGISFKEKVSGIITGLDADTHINLQNMIYQQYCVVGKARSGGNYYLLGNMEAGLDLAISTTTGLGAENTPDTTFTLTGESVDRALILESFLGANSILPISGGGTTVIVSNGAGVDILTYIASGGEGNSITFPVLAGKSILLFIRESLALDVVNTSPTPRQVQRSTSGDQFIFQSPLTAGESLKILYK